MIGRSSQDLGKFQWARPGFAEGCGRLTPGQGLQALPSSCHELFNSWTSCSPSQGISHLKRFAGERKRVPGGSRWTPELGNVWCAQPGATAHLSDSLGTSRHCRWQAPLRDPVPRCGIWQERLLVLVFEFWCIVCFSSCLPPGGCLTNCVDLK